MRALILFFLVVVAFLLVLKFYPVTQAGSGEVAKDEENALRVASPGPARFLSRPEREEPQQPEPEAPPAASLQEEPPRTSVPDWLSGVETPSGGDRGEVAVAAALVHGPAGDLSAALQAYPDFPEARARLAVAFATAMGGDRSSALRQAAEIESGELSAREKELLQVALGAESAPVTPASAANGSPLTLAMEMALLSRRGEALLAEGRHAEAALAYSSLLKGELEAPWEAKRETLSAWTQRLNQAQRQHRWNPQGKWPSVAMTVESGDSLTSVRKRYIARYPNRRICTGLIREANGIPAKTYLQPGQKLRIPIEEVTVVVDLSAFWALYLIGGEVAGSWPVGIGKPGEETPTGDFVAKDKIPEPPWMKVGQEPIPYGDSRNPLGSRWIGWYRNGGKTSYGFHGTAEPESVGTASSDGCIRFHNQDVERLFEILPEGSSIQVRP